MLFISDDKETKCPTDSALKKALGVEKTAILHQLWDWNRQQGKLR